MQKNRFYSFINIFGLSLGLASCMIIFLFVKNELSYDRFHPDAAITYRINSIIKISGQEDEIPFTSRLLAPALMEKFPEVSASIRLERIDPKVLSYEDELGGIVVKEDHFLYADSNFFGFFNFPLLVGDPARVLKDSSSIVLTEASARKLFGSSAQLSELLGKTIHMGDQKKAFRISGIAANVPDNSHIRFGVIAPTHTDPEYENSKWGSFQVFTYFKLKEEGRAHSAKLADLENGIQQFLYQKTEPEFQEVLNTSLDEFLSKGNRLETRLMPMRDIYLKSQMSDEMVPGGDIFYVYLFGASSLFIVLLACVNFMNLATARSANRAKEIGVRKVLGSHRPQLVMQFLLEGVFYSLLALVLAFLLVDLAMPFFNRLSGRELEPSFTDPFLLGFSILLCVLVGLLSGSYPAFYLSRFEPAQVLKGRVSLGYKSGRLRNFLVVFQFSVSIMLIIGTLLVHQQLFFLQKKPLGFEKENLLVIKNTLNLGEQSWNFKERVKNLPGVVSASFSSNMPGDLSMNASAFRMDGDALGTTMNVFWADKDFLETLGVDLKAGRKLDERLPADTASILINEAASKYLKGDNSLHQQIQFFIKTPPDFKVVGIVKDFNFKSLERNINPLGILVAEKGELMSVRISGDPIEQLMAIEGIWNEMLAGVPFEYYSIDQRFAEFSRPEEQMGRVMTVFTCMAIIIACLGLLGLAAFTAEQRSKEIGIRKVHGSSVQEIVLLLSTDFLKLVLIAFFIAAPFAYFAMDWWLDAFAYRIPLGFGAFLASGVMALLIASLTVSYQSFKAALANPVESLKEE